MPINPVGANREPFSISSHYRKIDQILVVVSKTASYWRGDALSVAIMLAASLLFTVVVVRPVHEFVRGD